MKPKIAFAVLLGGILAGKHSTAAALAKYQPGDCTFGIVKEPPPTSRYPTFSGKDGDCEYKWCTYPNRMFSNDNEDFDIKCVVWIKKGDTWEEPTLFKSMSVIGHEWDPDFPDVPATSTNDLASACDSLGRTFCAGGPPKPAPGGGSVASLTGGASPRATDPVCTAFRAED